MTTNLLPCPFCQCNDISIDVFCLCKECQASTGIFKTKEDAIGAWNTRTPQPVPDGYVLVPKKPTAKMLIAGAELADAHGFEPDTEMAHDIYTAMIEAGKVTG